MRCLTSLAERPFDEMVDVDDEIFDVGEILRPAVGRVENPAHHVGQRAFLHGIELRVYLVGHAKLPQPGLYLRLGLDEAAVEVFLLYLPQGVGSARDVGAGHDHRS